MEFEEQTEKRLLFTHQGLTHQKYVPLLKEAASELVKPFNEFIDNLSERYGERLEWWISSPASRNPFLSPLFYYCCYLSLLKKIIDRREPVEEIIVDSRALADIMNSCVQSAGSDIKIRFKEPSPGERVKDVARYFYGLFLFPLQELRLYAAAKITAGEDRAPIDEAITMVDTFVYGDSVEDRHYTGFWEAAPEDEKKRIFFLPTYHKPKNIKSLFGKLRRGPVNFILKEDYLKLSDYAETWKLFFALRRMDFKDSRLMDCDLSPLLREEMRNMKSYPATVSAMLLYRFVKRIKERGIKVRLFIDWYENQLSDRALNRGLHECRPEADRIGYMGYVTSSDYLSLYPTQKEFDFHVTPKELGVTGNFLIEQARSNCGKIRVKTVPAFRFSGLHAPRKFHPDPNRYVVFIALPGFLEESFKILKWFESGLRSVSKNFITVWVKAHPDIGGDLLRQRYGEEWPDDFQIVDGDFIELVEKSNLLVSTGSSVCMYGLAREVPVIVVGGNGPLDQNPIPEQVDSTIWRLVQSEGEMADAILHFLKERSKMDSILKKTAGEIIDNCFEAVSPEGINRLLML